MTVTANRASTAAGVLLGIEPLILHNTIVAGSFAADGTVTSDIWGPLPMVDSESSHNLIGVDDGNTGLVHGNGNLIGTVAAPLDPGLGPLADNGGPTWTHALLPHSPALDAGSNARATDAGSTADQRGAGFPRFVDGNTDGAATVDIGAFEANFAANGEIHGIVWNDLNGDGLIDANESGLANRTVFLDTDGDGQVGPTELSTTTGTDGSYQFLHLATPNTYTVAEVLPSGWTLTWPLPARTYTVPLSAGQVIHDAKFGNQGLVQVVDMSPEPGAVIQASPATIVVTFNGAIDPATVTTQTVRLVGSGGDGVFGNGNDTPIVPAAVILTQPMEITLDLTGHDLVPDVYQVTVVGNPIATRGLSFDGTDDYVSIPDSNSLDLTQRVTIEAWIKFAVDPSTISGRWLFVVDKREAWRLWYSPAGDGASDADQFFFDLWEWHGPNTKGIQWLADTWYHLAATYDGSVAKIYVNGELNNQVSVTKTLWTSNLPLTIGSISNGTSDSFPGHIDDVHIWSSSRTPEEIRADMVAQLTGNETNLVGCWQMEEGSGQTLLDVTPNQNHGTLGPLRWSAWA